MVVYKASKRSDLHKYLFYWEFGLIPPFGKGGQGEICNLAETMIKTLFLLSNGKVTSGALGAHCE
jgi:hypothetical protein